MDYRNNRPCHAEYTLCHGCVTSGSSVLKKVGLHVLDQRHVLLCSIAGDAETEFNIIAAFKYSMFFFTAREAEARIRITYTYYSFYTYSFMLHCA
jgi:hypothetical protein